MTAGVALPWRDDFEAVQSAWTRTGQWTVQAGAGRSASGALVDSPGDYNNSSDTSAQFAADLTGMEWPVLRFWDRYAVADNDWGRLSISVDGGASWAYVYGVAGTRTNWAEQVIDLSPWKSQPQVWVRFQMATDGGTQNDGWYVDDVVLEEQPQVKIPYPFFETFESGLSNWLHASWMAVADQAYAGDACVTDGPVGRLAPDTSHTLALAGDLDLASAVHPQLTFWVRGQMWWPTWFRVHVSTDGGASWSELVELNINNDFNPPDWLRKQASLAAYVGQRVRLRFYVGTHWGAGHEDVFLDNIGIGEDEPGAPTLHLPLPSSLVEYVRPTLVVNNAIDYQSEPVTYEFEVFADAAGTSLVARNPGVASGVGRTAWQVDVNLLNNHQYWWRCRAVQGASAGPWMDLETFYVNELNNAPLPVSLVIPPQWVLANTNGVLSWYPTVDPDAGDSIAAYQLQVDEEPNFSSPIIDDSGLAAGGVPPAGDWTLSVALSRFDESAQLVPGHVYFWRVRAQDTRFKWSEWSSLPSSFAFAFAPPPPPPEITSVRLNAQGEFAIEWVGATNRVYLEAASTLDGSDWATVAGPLSGSHWTQTPEATVPSRFFRLRAE